MKSSRVNLLVLLASFAFLLAGCKGGGSVSNTSSGAPSATSNSNKQVEAQPANRNATSASSAPGSTPTPLTSQPQLVGSYESVEVHDKGVVTLMSKLKTTILFQANGSYARVSQAMGKTYHADSGMFRIDPPDNLVLTIQVTGQKIDRKIVNPPKLRTHKFTLSPDGEELRMTSEKGATAIFRRVARPNPS